MNPALRAHLAEAARIARPDWPPNAIGKALAALDDLADPQALLAVAAAAADPEARPDDLGEFGVVVHPARVRSKMAPGLPDPRRIARGAELVRRTLAERGHDDRRSDGDSTGDGA